jgi:manganese/zinc/iron transport system permease protein
MALIVFAVVIGLQAVGVVLMAALLIVPAAAARLWTDRLGSMVVAAGAIGGASGVLGTLLSLQALRLPTGPLVVLSSTAIFTVSLLVAPRRGLLPRALRFVALRRRVGRENVLRSMYEMAEEAGGRMDRPADAAAIAARRGQPGRAAAAQLAARTGTEWTLTPAGLVAAHAVVRNHRLWEMFLMYEGQLGVDHIDRDADTIEHWLAPEIVNELERFLRLHGLEPTLRPVPEAGT